jgi:PEP-CTERM motif-containing protein
VTNNLRDKTKSGKRNFFATGRRGAKDWTSFALILVCLHVLSALNARADGLNIIFLDSSESPTASVTGTATNRTITNQGCSVQSTSFSNTGVAEVCTLIVLSTNGAEIGDFSPIIGIAEASDPTQMGDLGPVIGIRSIGNVIRNEYVLQFISDLTTPLFACNQISNLGCNLVEDGTVQPLGTVNWSDSTTDTLQFQSDVSDVPEPSSILLLLTGFAGLRFAKLRRKVAARKKWLA